MVNLIHLISVNEKLLQNAGVDGEHFETKMTFSNVSGLERDS